MIWFGRRIVFEWGISDIRPGSFRKTRSESWQWSSIKWPKRSKSIAWRFRRRRLRVFPLLKGSSSPKRRNARALLASCTTSLVNPSWRSFWRFSQRPTKGRFPQASGRISKARYAASWTRFIVWRTGCAQAYWTTMGSTRR